MFKIVTFIPIKNAAQVRQAKVAEEQLKDLK